MRAADFDYELPEELIAQLPAPVRDTSRLLVARGHGQRKAAPSAQGAGGERLAGDPGSGGLEHRRFHDLPELLRPGDLLVVNDARVVPARIEARRPSGGRVELLFVGPAARPEGAWRALARPARRVRAGDRLAIEGGPDLLVHSEGEGGERLVSVADGSGVEATLERHGHMPLPPYIHPDAGAEREGLDRERYQTVYAARPGAVAAPTAGLHFTPELLEALDRRGVEIARLTLYVGPGTFRPITADDVLEHRMDGERFEIDAETAHRVDAARAEGRRVIAVGTTAVRTLEHAGASGRVLAGRGVADLYITPGYRFRVVDAMITNFHLPRSTPLLLVAALLGRDLLLDAYREAVRERYRFYSYGDAMLVLP